ncbi:unnamed protein product [Musa textilis]
MIKIPSLLELMVKMESFFFYFPSLLYFILESEPLVFYSSFRRLRMEVLGKFGRLQVEEGTDMEALKPSLRMETMYAAQQLLQDEGVSSEEACWVVERGNSLGEGFAVDDLLNLGEFAEDEMKAEEVEVGGKFETEAGAQHTEPERCNSYSSPPSSSSALSFELPPPPPLSDIFPAHDAEELEWVSYIIDDSITEFPPPCSGVAPLARHENRHPRTASPQGQRPFLPGPSVCALSTEAMAMVKAKRSKRSRSATAAWSKSGPVPFADTSSFSSADNSTTTSAASCSSTSSSSPLLVHDQPAGGFDQSFLIYGHHPPPRMKQKPKKRGRKPRSRRPPPAAIGERRCSHCGAQKTPQWRAGPLGSKTLCNACGVRFKSGRLLPEYRPACSPTFVSHMHSNSHRKVLEMRRQKEGDLITAAAPPVVSF